MIQDKGLDQTTDAVKNSHDTNDKDLIELAGYHAYRNYKTSEVIEIKGKDFEVKNTIHDPDSGFRALTVENLETDEISIVYVGSEPNVQDWIFTNPMLLSDTPPQQIQDAIDYYDWVNDKIGDVSSITGNSLAGALTNAVSIENPVILYSYHNI